MKQTQRKDAIRNVIKQVVSYLSIVVIAMLAVTTYLGINFASNAIENNGDEFYKKTNFRDIQVISTKLLSEEDIEVIRNVQGVSDVEGVFRTDAKVSTNGKTTDVMVVSLTSRINTVEVIEGRLPESANECVLEKTVDDDTGLKIGDTVKVADSKGGTPQYLTGSEYVITGLVFHPDHSCWPLVAPGTRYILVMPDAFDKKALDNSYMTAEVAVEGTEGMSVFDKKYLNKVNETVKRIDEISGERSQIRFNYVKEKYAQTIADNQVKLDDAKKQLADARAELDKKWAEYNDGIKKLDEAKAAIEDSEKKIADGKVKLDDAAAQLADGKKQLDDGKVKLDSANAQLKDGEKKLESAKKELKSTYKQLEKSKGKIRKKLKDSITKILGKKIADKINWSKSNYKINVNSSSATATKLRISKGVTIDLNKSMGDNIFKLISSLGIPEKDLKEAYEKTTGRILKVAEKNKIVRAIVDEIVKKYNSVNVNYKKLASAARKWDKGHNTYISKHNEYLKAKSKYEAGLKTYKTNLDNYNKGKTEYENGLKDYNQGLANLDKAKKEYEDGRKLAEEGLKQLKEGEEKYEKGLADYNDGVKALNKARDDMSLLDSCRWVVLDVNGNVGYSVIDNGRMNVSDLGTTFALIFVLVGALVIYATVGRIVEEQRRLVGATKALGLFNKEILIKYMFFGVTGTLIGMILGFILGFTGIQSIVLAIYGRYYVFGRGKSAIDIVLTLIVFAGGLILSSFTVWFACTNLMKSTAIVLMQESVPGYSKKSRKEKPAGKKKKGSLYGRMILLNMLSDKKRVVVTIASIAGVCCLLVAGMTMNYAVKKSIDQQFKDIEVYDLKITFDSTESETAEEDFENVLKEEGVDYICLCDRMSSYDFGGKLICCELLCGDMEKLNGFFRRCDPSMQLITESGDGVWIHSKTASMNNLNVGDKVTLYDSVMNPYSSTITGIFENRVGWYAVIDNETYFDVFGKRAENNTYFVNLNGKGSDAVSSRVSKVKGFMECQDKQERYGDIKKMANALDLLSVLFVVIAGMMSYFILLNLVNMYIAQKQKELTIMRINGFTVKETIRYVSLELIVSTVIGIVIGLSLGSALGYRILEQIEGAGLNIIKNIQLEAWAIAAVITVVFAFVISAWALRKVKYLKLTDV